MKILMSCFGSGGDLFPLIPIADRLIEGGDEVVFAVPRTLGLYLRALGYPSIALGDGAEARVLGDDAMFTTADDGRVSWSATWDHYVEPALASSVDVLASALGTHRPDLVVTTSFAAAARIAARRHGVPHLALSMYPQHFAMHAGSCARRPDAFAPRYKHAAIRLARAEQLDDVAWQLLAWGIDPDGLLMHDQVLLGDTTALPPGLEITGFPYWDSADLGSVDELSEATAWLTSSADPAVVITQGSFIGHRGVDAWRDSIDAVTTVGLRAALVGARGRWAHEELGGRSDLLATGYLPLSEVAPLAALGIHHGGLGTTFAFLHAGVPTVVRPHAYDQSFNGALLDAAHAGITDAVGDATTLTMALEVASLLDGTGGWAIHDVQARLTPPSVAADRLAAEIHRAAAANS